MSRREAPVYYVAIRKATEPRKMTVDPFEDISPPKPVGSSAVDSAAIRDAAERALSFAPMTYDPNFTNLTQRACADSFKAASSKQRRDVNAAVYAVDAALGRGSFLLRGIPQGARAEALTAAIEDGVILADDSNGGPGTALRGRSLVMYLLSKLRGALLFGNGTGARKRRSGGLRVKPIIPATDVSDRVVSLQFEDNEQKSDKLTLVVDNFDLSQFDDPLFERGNIIEFTYGYADALAPIREAVIRSVKGGAQLTIEAHGKDVIMDRVKRRQAWTNITRSGVVQEIAERNGYPVEQQAIEETEVVYETLVQPNLTDAQFLRKLARKQGFEFFVDYDGLHWHKRNVEQAPIREVIYYVDPGHGDVLSFNVENDLTRKPARIRIKGTNPSTGEQFSVHADSATETDRDVLQPTTVTEDLLFIDPVSGARRDGEREVTVSPGITEQPIAYEQDVVVPVLTKEEAQVEASHRYRKAQQRSVKLTLTLVGDALLLGKSVIQCTGFGKAVSGRYYVQQVVHMISSGGPYTMTSKCITDGFGSGQRGRGAGKGAVENQSLEAAIQRLLDATALSNNAQIRSVVVFAVSSIRNRLGPGINKASASDAARTAQTLVGQIQSAGKLDTGAQRDAGKAVVHAAAALAGVCLRLSQQSETETTGRLNEKPVQQDSIKELQQALDKFFIAGDSGTTSTN